jgi:hypothetical protein
MVQTAWRMTSQIVLELANDQLFSNNTVIIGTMRYVLGTATTTTTTTATKHKKTCFLLVIGEEEGKLFLVPQLEEGCLCLTVLLCLPHSRICPVHDDNEVLGLPRYFKFTEKAFSVVCK